MRKALCSWARLAPLLTTARAGNGHAVSSRGSCLYQRTCSASTARPACGDSNAMRAAGWDCHLLAHNTALSLPSHCTLPAKLGWCRRHKQAHIFSIYQHFYYKQVRGPTAS